MSSYFDKTVTIEVPADALGKSIDEPVVQDVVEVALRTGPCVVRNHVHGAFNEFLHELTIGNERDQYEAAVKLAGVALRYAWENRFR